MAVISEIRNLIEWGLGVMVFNATFNNISTISWRFSSNVKIFHLNGLYAHSWFQQILFTLLYELFPFWQAKWYQSSKTNGNDNDFKYNFIIICRYLNTKNSEDNFIVNRKFTTLFQIDFEIVRTIASFIKISSGHSLIIKLIFSSPGQRPCELLPSGFVRRPSVICC